MSWKSLIKPKSKDAHKYDYGHVVVYGGAQMTGAACLASVAALRMGVGLVTVATPKEVANVYRSFCPSLIVEELGNFKDHFQDERRTSIIIGPGAGQGIEKAVSDAVLSDKVCVLDADALSQVSLKETHAHCVLTPHEGEFAKLFPDIGGSKIERAKQAAKLSNAIVVLKGAETVIVAPDGRHETFNNGSPWLATAGTGDVLAGMIGGFGAYHRDELFEAVCASVWMHGEASQLAGPGMISADLIDFIPKVWRNLLT